MQTYASAQADGGHKPVVTGVERDVQGICKTSCGCWLLVVGKKRDFDAVKGHLKTVHLTL